MIFIGSIWQLAELEILSCEKILSHGISLQLLPYINADENLSNHNNINKSEDCFVKDMFEYKIRLITGRTHQIRLQFAAMGMTVIFIFVCLHIDYLYMHSYTCIILY
jgi:hypothetical protein